MVHRRSNFFPSRQPILNFIMGPRNIANGSLIAQNHIKFFKHKAVDGCLFKVMLSTFEEFLHRQLLVDADSNKLEEIQSAVESYLWGKKWAVVLRREDAWRVLRRIRAVQTFLH